MRVQIKVGLMRMKMKILRIMSRMGTTRCI